MLLSKEISQLSLTYKIFNLLFQIETFVYVVPMVSMEATILVPITFIGISPHFLQPLQGRIILDLHENLLKGHVQWRVLLILCRRACLLVILVLLILRSSLLWTRTLIKMTRRVSFHSLSSLPLLSYVCIIYIHKVLGRMDEFSHELRFFLIKLVDE